MNRFIESLAFIFLISVLCISPQFCYGDAINKQPDESAKSIIPATGASLSPDDPEWQTAGGFSLYAAPEKPRFSFGEDIIFKLKLKNEINVDLQYDGPGTFESYHVTISNSIGDDVPEWCPSRVIMHSVSYMVLPAGESIDQDLCLNNMFIFPSAGIYTARVWRYVGNREGKGSVKLYSNKFTFELYGDPTNPKNNKTPLKKAQLYPIDIVKRFNAQPLQTINTKHKYTLPGSYANREWRSVGFVGERNNTSDFAFKLHPHAAHMIDY